MWLEIDSRMRCSITFLRVEVRLTGQGLLGLFFLQFLTGVTFVFFQFSGTSPDFHTLSNMIVSSLAMVSTTSFSTHGHSLSGPMDLWMSDLLRCSLTQSSFLPPVLYACLLGQRCRRDVLSDQCKDVQLLCVLCYHHPHSI